MPLHPDIEKAIDDLIQVKVIDQVIAIRLERAEDRGEVNGPRSPKWKVELAGTEGFRVTGYGDSASGAFARAVHNLREYLADQRSRRHELAKEADHQLAQVQGLDVDVEVPVGGAS